MVFWVAYFSMGFDFWELVDAKAKISDSATDSINQATMEGVLVRLLAFIFPNKSLGSLNTYLTREREDCETISRAVAIYEMIKAC